VAGQNRGDFLWRFYSGPALPCRGVTLGTIMLIVITLRCAKGHFTADRHFGFEAVAWYWHFVWEIPV
jgi:heme/copper-type cytochrome/quinol oxidase subunit 3